MLEIAGFMKASLLTAELSATDFIFSTQGYPEQSVTVHDVAQVYTWGKTEIIYFSLTSSQQMSLAAFLNVQLSSLLITGLSSQLNTPCVFAEMLFIDLQQILFVLCYFCLIIC